MDGYSEILTPSEWLVKMVRRCGLFLSKVIWQIEYHDTENIPSDQKKGLILVSNHPTYFDPFWVGFPVNRPLRFMAWDKAFDWFLVGNLLRKLGAFPVNLKGRGNYRALKISLKFLKRGETLVIFPEGEREFSDGNLLEFKPGFIYLAQHANVPILPVSIKGGNRIWSRDDKFPKPGKVKVYFHPVIYLKGNRNDLNPDEFSDAITKNVKEIINSKL